MHVGMRARACGRCVRQAKRAFPPRPAIQSRARDTPFPFSRASFPDDPTHRLGCAILYTNSAPARAFRDPPAVLLKADGTQWGYVLSTGIPVLRAQVIGEEIRATIFEPTTRTSAIRVRHVAFRLFRAAVIKRAASANITILSSNGDPFPMKNNAR